MSRLAPLVGLLSVLSFASLASADVIPPGEAACQSSSAGAACRVDGVSGTCAMSRCSRLDYAGWDRDASPAPPRVEYDCLVCEPGEPSRDDDGGCSVSAVGAGASSSGLFVVTSALVAWAMRRRRASR